MPDYPSLMPTRRAVSLGDWPVKSYRTINGDETRIRYGNKKSEATLELFYEKLTDTEADQFVSHYDWARGTYKTFAVGAPLTTGWRSGAKVQGTSAWRYDGPPKFNQNGGDCNRMNLTVKLKTVN